MKKSILYTFLCFSFSLGLLAEGEYWAPAYNKLTRLINQKAYLAGESYSPQSDNPATPEDESETQQEADQRYLQTHAIIAPNTRISQSHLNALRSRLWSLASTKYYSSAEASQHYIELELDANQQPILDENGNPTLKSPSVFEDLDELSGSKDPNAWTRIFADYTKGKDSFAQSFSTGPVFWEHFQQIKDFADKLKHLGNNYGEQKYNQSAPFSSAAMLQLALDVAKKTKEKTKGQALKN